MECLPKAFSLQPSAFPHIPPISSRGNVNEIMSKFGGPDQLRNAVNLPSVLKDDTDFAILFILCFPHRLTRALAKHLEEKTTYIQHTDVPEDAASYFTLTDDQG
jgi:hypothetical protein